MGHTNGSAGGTAVIRILDNGLNLTCERLPHLRSAAIGLWIRTGSVNETAPQSGISHFLEHLFFKGTKTRTARDLVEAIERHGGQLNAFTSRDYTCVHAKTLDSHVATAIEILADIVKHSQFYDLEKERNVVLEEIASVEDVPEDLAHERLALKLWPDQSLGRPVSGTVETVSALSLEDIRAYYDAWYNPGNFYFSIAGNFDEDAVVEQVCREFGDWQPAPLAEDNKPAIFGGGVENIEREIAQTHVCLGFPGPVATDPRRYVYDVLSSALGGGSTSRLFERIREDEGLAYTIYAYHSAHRAAGMLGIYAAVAPQNLSKAFDITFEELRKFRETPMSADELDINREQLKGGLLMALENTFVRMSRMAKSMMYFGRMVSVEEVIEAVDAVMAEDVRSLADDIFKPESCALVTVGPPGSGANEQVPL